MCRTTYSNSYIHILMACKVPTSTSGAVMGFSILLKATLTCSQGELNQQPSNNKTLALTPEPHSHHGQQPSNFQHLQIPRMIQRKPGLKLVLLNHYNASQSKHSKRPRTEPAHTGCIQQSSADSWQSTLRPSQHITPASQTKVLTAIQTDTPSANRWWAYVQLK